MASRRLTQDDVRRMALTFPDAHVGEHMGHADLRVRNKIFASLPNDPTTVAMKISPANLDALVRDDPETFRNVWGGRWLGVALPRVKRPVLLALLRDAWEMTAPAGLRAGAPKAASAGGTKSKSKVERKVRAKAPAH